MVGLQGVRLAKPWLGKCPKPGTDRKCVLLRWSLAEQERGKDRQCDEHSS